MKWPKMTYTDQLGDEVFTGKGFVIYVTILVSITFALVSFIDYAYDTMKTREEGSCSGEVAATFSRIPSMQKSVSDALADGKLSYSECQALEREFEDDVNKANIQTARENLQN
jgi:hypothetical protein